MSETADSLQALMSCACEAPLRRSVLPEDALRSTLRPWVAKTFGFKPMTAEPDDFDLSAAWLRRAKGDMSAFVEALAARLEAALPDAVTIERHRDGLFSRTSHVSRIAVRTETGVLTLAIAHGRVHATRATIVRGVSIGSEDITVPVWLDAVLRSVRTLGEDAEAAHDALHTFLMA